MPFNLGIKLPDIGSDVIELRFVDEVILAE